MPLNASINNSQSDAEFQPPRCTHELMSGDTCGQPALRGQQVCRFHREIRPRTEFILPEIEDAASLQLALNRIMRALADDLLTPKKASLLLYACQTAATNLKRLHDERKEQRQKNLEQQEQREKNPGEETSLLRLLLEKLQIEETPEELAAMFDAEQEASADGKRKAPWWESDTHAAEPEEAALTPPEVWPGSPTRDRETRARHTSDQQSPIKKYSLEETNHFLKRTPAEAMAASPQPLTTSATDQKENTADIHGPKNHHSTKVNINACADPWYRKPITDNRKPSKRQLKKLHPARGPAGWTM